LAAAALWVATWLGGCATEESTGAALYTVRAQDTLYSIAWRHNLDYRELARWNHLGPDFRITVGQRLLLAPPSGGAAPPARPKQTAASPAAGATSGGASSGGAAGGSASGGNAAGGREIPRSNPAASAGARALEGIAIPHLNWVWPTERSVTPRPVQSGGILFSGHLGQDVRAAAAGRVVYTGSGIRGYGQLVIVKHSDVLLSAYAYNRDVLVSEGDEVSAGQPIAHMGEGAHRSPVLYFEIRVNGKPIDPLPFLSGQK
jgi:lipoprotein NlpD